MTDYRHDEEAIFNVARRLPPDQRSVYLKQVCGDNRTRQAHVESLLKAHEDDGFLELPSPEAAPTLDRPFNETPGTVVGRFKLLQKIGEGGFGVVFMAEQQSPVIRRVALKVIKPGMDSHAVVARFEAERQALALMDHPNIAHILDGGITESGRPYFVMELVKGLPITAFCDKNDLSTEGRLELFIDVCKAVQHAHHKGVIHRDLKPSNILVTLHDGKPVPKVIDFGVSKALHQRLTEKTLFTAFGQMIGTAQYMSPEQAEMSGLDVDTRSDVYSLGVLLYELLTGTTPLEAANLREAGYAEIQRMIRETEPPRPSVRLSSEGEGLTAIAKHRSIDPNALQRLVSGDLDWIVMKALEKERGRRYENTSDFATDVQQFLAGDAVEAHPPSPTYRLRKFVRRRRSLVVAVLVVATTLILGITGTTIGMFLAFTGKSEADLQRKSAIAAQIEAVDAKDIAEIARTEAVEAERLAVQEAELRRREQYRSDMNAACFAWEESDIGRVVELLRRHRPDGNDDLRGFEWYHLWRLCRDSMLMPRIEFPYQIISVSFSPGDDTSVAVGMADQTAALVDLATGRTVDSFGTRVKGRVSSHTHVAFSPKDDRLFAYTIGSDIHLRNLATGKEQLLDDHQGHVSGIAFSPDGKRLASGDQRGSVFVWDMAGGKVDVPYRVSGVGAIAFSFDKVKPHFACGGRDGTIYVFNAEDGGKLAEFSGHTDKIESLEFSRSNKYLASASNDNTAKIWDVESRSVVHTLNGHADDVRSVCFSPDSTILASGSRDNTAKLWDVASGKEIRTLKGHSGGVLGVAFSHSGNTFATASGDRSLVLWDLKDQVVDDIVQCKADVTSLMFLPESQTLASANWNSGVIDIYDTEAGEFLSSLSVKDTASQFTISQQGVLAVGHRTGMVELWDLALKTKVATHPGNDGVVDALAFSPCGNLLATGGSDSVVRVLNVETGEEVLKLEGHEDRIRSLTFSPNGNKLASGSLDRTIILWNIKEPEPELSRRRLDGHKGAVLSLAFSPDGNTLASASWDYSVKLWNLTDEMSDEETLLGHPKWVSSVVFSADGKTLFSGSGDRTVKIWDVATRQLKWTVYGHQGGVNSIALSPDGNTLASGSLDRTIRLWRRASKHEVESTKWN